jgi:hypothetical protein
MTPTVYLNESVKKRLFSLVLKHHDIRDVLFWLDLSICHYSKIALDHLLQKNRQIEQKVNNPLNVAQARGIGKFWGICKQQYISRQHEPKNLQGFKRVWSKISNDSTKDPQKRAWRTLGTWSGQSVTKGPGSICVTFLTRGRPSRTQHVISKDLVYPFRNKVTVSRVIQIVVHTLQSM